MLSLCLGGISSSLRLISFPAVGEIVWSRCGEAAANACRLRPRNTNPLRRARSLFSEREPELSGGEEKAENKGVGVH